MAETLAQAIERVAALLGERPAVAARDIDAVLRQAPRDPRALLISASAKRRLGDHAGALSILRPLAQAYPNAARTQYELGLASAASGDVEAGIDALRRATALSPDLAEAWGALGDLLFAKGDLEGTALAVRAHIRAGVTDPNLKEAAQAVFEERLSDAEAMLRAHLRERPDHGQAIRLLALVFGRQNRALEAERLWRLYIQIASNDPGARFELAAAVFRQQKSREAIAMLDQILAKAPNDAPARNLLAACLGMVGDDARGVDLNAGLVRDFPRHPMIRLNYGHALRAVGRRAEAVAAYKETLVLAPTMGAAYWALANMKVETFSPEQEAAIDALAARPDLPAEDRLYIHFARGKALEDRGEFAGSFEHYAAGAAAWRTNTPYDPEHNTALAKRNKAVFTRDFFSRRSAWGTTAIDPIFVVGLPRSGSTLIEQILASHSQVEGTMELPYIGLIALEFGTTADGRPGGPGFPEGLQNLTAAAAQALGERYLADAKINRQLGRPRFVDKMPNNFHSLGLIQTILPNARIIDARRNPMATGFAAFKQHFAQGQAFSYDLTDLGRYYRDYMDLMAHFDAVLPGRVHRVIYEDMVEDTEAQIRALLDHCGLPFEESCLNFWQTERTVRTVSSEQVRRPIFREGLDQWRNYEPWLGPLREALGPALETWRG